MAENKHIPRLQIDIAQAQEARLQEIREKLARGAHVYGADLLGLIRAYGKDRRVVMFDVDDVLRARNGDINPHALRVIQDLKAMNYGVIFWTAGNAEAFNGYEGMDELKAEADFVVTADNYDRDGHRTGSDPLNADFQHALNTATWIPVCHPDRAKSPWQDRSIYKHPEVFFKNVTVIEDGGVYYHYYYLPNDPDARRIILRDIPIKGSEQYRIYRMPTNGDAHFTHVRVGVYGNPIPGENMANIGEELPGVIDSIYQTPAITHS